MARAKVEKVGPGKPERTMDVATVTIVSDSRGKVAVVAAGTPGSPLATLADIGARKIAEAWDEGVAQYRSDIARKAATTRKRLAAKRSG